MVFLITLIGASIISSFLAIYYVFSGKVILSPVLARFGAFEIRYYSLFALAGILLAYILARKEAKKEGINLELFDEMIFFGILMGIVGARVFYVIFNLNYYAKNPLEVFMIWRGGLSIYGALIFGVLTVVIYLKVKKPVNFNVWQILDIGATFFPLGQAIGRWGNFFNYEAYGAPTNLVWKMYVPARFRLYGYENYEFFHPTFLYEFLWNLFVFLLLKNFYDKYKKSHGEVFGLYLALYSLGRICIERIRLDNLLIGQIRASQLIAAITMICGSLIFLYRRRELKT
ncbi:prolipoprotein diacylglyceryl transferase [Pseudothermotoga thermarum]|uniref:Phosphatidylglycerol--prolipoprotein diacylglyceryl transferase n=1 Tax=Pseudothermotoga thermarum DSM 5069 TaxID=688269 RepID=F7YYA4_9THEM|nr:prolipoprotein diacylglyceryl transferase [Pseudothermotoga thermarum]AEH50925.1 prolipoprotein diacylglyceryl transferase [Pseudothermotoga thermarum DSM 5069]